MKVHKYMIIRAFICTEGQIKALDRIQKKAAEFTNHTKDFDWENLAQRRMIACLCALFKAYSGEWAWKATCDRLRRPYCLSRVDHVQKIRDRKQRTDIGMYSFINRIYSLTAIGLTPGGSSTVHIYTQTIRRTTQ